MAKCLAVKTSNGLEPTAQVTNTATAIKLALLQEQANQGFNWNTEEWLTESGNYTAPVSGYYEVTVIGGGNGGRLYIDSLGTYAGDSGGIIKEIVFMEKGSQKSVIIGSGGSYKVANSGYTGHEYEGGITRFGDLNSSHAPIFHGQIDRANYKASLVGGGLGGGSAFNLPDAAYYGGGGGVVRLSQTEYEIGNGYQGAVCLRYFDPSKVQLPTIDTEVLTPYLELLKRVDALETEVFK